MRDAIPTLILALSALLFLAVGVAFVVSPQGLLERIQVDAPPGTALTDIRAVYGGLDFGVGVFLFYCLATGARRSGLVASTLVLVGLAGGRIVGIVVDPSQEPITYTLLASEVVGTVLSGIGLALDRTKS